MALEAIEKGERPLYFRKGEEITAKSIAEAAQQADPTAVAVYRTAGQYLGKGLSLLLDILNPERIVIGSVFVRSQALLWDAMQSQINQEALIPTARCCRIVPAALGEEIGDYAAVATALLGE